MAFKYRDYVAHAVTFYAEGEEGRNTWEDWRLVPTSRPVIPPPAPLYNFVEIPGTSAEIDMTEVLTGQVEYNAREGSIEFAVINKTLWIDVYTEIMNYLAGKRVRFVLADEPGYFYQGRAAVNDWASNADYSVITINYHVQPHKYPKTQTLDRWEYDPAEILTGGVL